VQTKLACGRAQSTHQNPTEPKRNRFGGPIDLAIEQDDVYIRCLDQ